MRPDPETLMSEVAVFRSFVEAKNKGFTLMSDIGQFANENKATFPLTNAYRLALTAPVTVAKNERSFRKIETGKNNKSIQNAGRKTAELNRNDLRERYY